MELWLTFFGIVAIGGLLVFFVLRRERRGPTVLSHSPDEGPRFDVGGGLRGGSRGGPAPGPGRGDRRR